MSEQHAPTPEPTSASAPQGVDSGRRKFTGAGLAGSGVILTLASKPVMGSNYWCTGSGGMSGNTSSHGDQPVCLACSPGYWKTSPESWPSPYYPYAVCDSLGQTRHAPTLFADVFGSCPWGSDKTMMWVLQNQNGSREWHACGALLNAAKATQLGLASAYTVTEVISLYQKGAPATTFSSTWEDNMHHCPLPNYNDSIYHAENQPFCNLIDANGQDTGQCNPACSNCTPTPKKKP